MMEVQITCTNCGSSIEVLASQEAHKVSCDICQHVMDVKFSPDHEQGNLKNCPICSRQDFYKQKDFNRKIGVLLFIVAAGLSIYTYGLSLPAAWLIDVYLVKRLSTVAVCYKCQTIFRKVKNLAEIRDFDHEMNDRIVYSDHDFKGKPLSH
jgi:hypothetical protein